MTGRRGFLGQLLAAAAFSALHQIMPALAPDVVARRVFTPALQAVYSSEILDYARNAALPLVTLVEGYDDSDLVDSDLIF